MQLPAWASPHHPIAKREINFWRRTFKRWGWMWVLLPIFPCVCTGLITLFMVPLALDAASPILTFAVLAGWGVLSMLWILGSLLNWALGTFANIGAAVMVARERETHNWAMLRLTAMPVREIINAKMAALMRLIFWPAVVVIGLGVVSLLLTGAAASAGILVLGSTAPTNEFPPELEFGIVALILGSVPVIAIYAIVATLISLLYNCAVGLFTSTLTHTTAGAVILSFAIHFGLLMFVFVPVQQIASIAVQLMGGAVMMATQSPLVFFLFTPIVSFVLPIALQVAIGLAAFSFALNQAQKIIE